MTELSFAYLLAAAIIAGLAYLARKNRQQGWSKQRRTWAEIYSAATVGAFDTRETRVDGPSPYAAPQHLTDLARLHESLVAASEVPCQEPSPAESEKNNLLTWRL